MIFLYLLMLFYQTGQFVDTHFFFFDKINLTISIITVCEAVVGLVLIINHKSKTTKRSVKRLNLRKV